MKSTINIILAKRFDDKKIFIYKGSCRFFSIMNNVKEVYLDIAKYEIQRVRINPTRINVIFEKKG